MVVVMFAGKVTLSGWVFILDWVELGLEEVEGEKDGLGFDKEEAGDEVREELVVMK